MLQVCLNGSLRRSEHPAVPITPSEVAADAVRCEAAGASAVHVHVRDDEERESLTAEAVARTVTAVRVACPELPVGVSTGAWIEPDPDARIAAIRSWTVLPDFASVNVHEVGADRVATVLRERGIGVEAGIWHRAAVDTYLGWRTPALRVLLECLAVRPQEALAEAGELVAGLRRAAAPVLLHGQGDAAWAVLGEAVRRGFDRRIGLEDALTLPDGSPAWGNAALVGAAVGYRGGEP